MMVVVHPSGSGGDVIAVCMLCSSSSSISGCRDDLVARGSGRYGRKPYPLVVSVSATTMSLVVIYITSLGALLGCFLQGQRSFR
jgi:hypothetical protein